MAKNIQSLQLLRNGTLFASKEAAKNALTGFTTTNQPSADMDGVAVLARYSGESATDVKTLVGFYYSGANATTVTIFDSEALADAESKINNIISGVGLNENGTYSANISNAYTNDAESVADAVDKLDAAISAVSATVDSASASTVSGESKVVIDVTQEEGKITASAANITGVKLDGYTVGGDDSRKIADTDTLGQALGKLQGQINGMDKTATSGAGQVVVTVTQTDGKVAEEKANVKDLQLGGYTKDASASGDIASDDTINAALSKLENSIEASKTAVSVKNQDGTITVTPPTGGESGTAISVHIKEGEKVLASSVSGLYTDIKLQKITTGLTANLEAQYKLIGTDGTQLGSTTIDIKKDSAIQEIYLGTSEDTINETTGEITKQEGVDKQYLNYAYIKANGTYGLVKINVSTFLAESEFASGVTATGGIAHGVVDPTSETFLTVGADGFKLSGVQDAINSAITALDVTGDTAVAGQYVAAIEETDGKVAVKTRANVSDAVLNGYSKGSDATAIAATDTVNQAISKLENQVDKAKAAATTKVVEGDDEGNHLSISSATSETDSSVTYTINLADVASASALTAETAAREAADTELSNRLGGGVTTANTATAQLAALSGNSGTSTSGETSVEGAKRYADEKVAELSGKSITAITSVNNSISATTSTTDGSVAYDIVTDASKIQMSGFTADTSGFTAISESSSVTEAFKAVESYVLETEEVTAAALTDLDARIKAISGDSSSNLAAEIAARKAVDGQSGNIYAANSSTNYISAATSLNDADIKLDTAIKGAQDEIDAIENAVGLDADGRFIAPSGSVVSTASSVKDALEKLDAALKDTNLTAGSGITITNNAGNEDEISVKLASSHTVNNQTVENPLKFDGNGGLYFDTLDCGTY